MQSILRFFSTFCFIYVFPLFTPGINAIDDLEHIYERLRVLENQYEIQAKENVELKSCIDHLETRNLEQERIVESLRHEVSIQQARIATLEHFVQERSNSSLTKINGGLSNIFTHGRKKRGVSVGSGVAFHAHLSHDLINVGLNQAIVFDFVLLNRGNGYSNRDGVFVTPVSGIYVFYWNLMSNEDRGMDTLLSSSGGHLGYGFVSPAPNSFQNGGNMVIAQLNAGVHVWVLKADTYGDVLHERFTTFSGSLLYETE